MTQQYTRAIRLQQVVNQVPTVLTTSTDLTGPAPTGPLSNTGTKRPNIPKPEGFVLQNLSLATLPIPKIDDYGCPYLHFSDDYTAQLTDSELPTGDTATSALVYNLAVSALLEERESVRVPIVISLQRAAYSLPPECYPFRHRKLSYRKVRQALTNLEKLGLVQITLGSRASGKRTTLLPTEKFLDLLARTGSIEAQALVEKGHLLLRSAKCDEKPRVLLPYPDNRQTQDIQYNLRTINDAVVRYQYTYIPLQREGRTTLAPNSLRYNRLYIGDFETLGRFYADFQNLKKEERRTIRIDGEETVELDYSGISLSILYHLTTGQLPAGDLYHVEGVPTEYRDYVKHAVVVMLNCDDWYQARAAISANKPEDFPLSATELRDLILKQHAPIADYFLNGRGLWLQNIDSRICESVLLSFAVINKPILAIHDGFLVGKSDRDFLRNKMESAYQSTLRKLNRNYSGELPRIK
jgi:hypothetical protein